MREGESAGPGGGSHPLNNACRICETRLLLYTLQMLACVRVNTISRFTVDEDEQSQ